MRNISIRRPTPGSLDPGWGSRALRKTAKLTRCCYAERYAREIPVSVLVRIKSAGHIPMENDPKAAAGALAEFFVAER